MHAQDFVCKQAHTYTTFFSFEEPPLEERKANSIRERTAPANLIWLRITISPETLLSE
jgi:hypothetical protein